MRAPLTTLKSAGLYISLLSTLSLSQIQCSNETGIRELEPPQGTYLGGEEIVIHGRNYPIGRGGASVTFGRRAATNVVMENQNRIKVTSPAGDKNTEVDIVLMFDDGRAYLLKNGFRYLDAGDNQKVMKNFKMK